MLVIIEDCLVSGVYAKALEVLKKLKPPITLEDAIETLWIADGMNFKLPGSPSQILDDLKKLNAIQLVGESDNS